MLSEDFKNKYLQQPITFLTEENLDKLETHCRKAVNFERGVEHKVVLELLDRYYQHQKELKDKNNRITKLQKENEELKSDNLEKARILEVFDDRKYRKKYLEERRKEVPNLLYPDGDEIYKRYYEQKKQIDLMAEKIFYKLNTDKFEYGYSINEVKTKFEKLAKEKGE